MLKMIMVPEKQHNEDILFREKGIFVNIFYFFGQIENGSCNMQEHIIHWNVIIFIGSVSLMYSRALKAFQFLLSINHF